MKSLLLLTLSQIPQTLAEHRHFDGPISAASNYIHYSEGYVITPGYVDISNLEFEAISETLVGQNKLFEGSVLGEGVDDVYVDDDGERVLDNGDGVNTVSYIIKYY